MKVSLFLSSLVGSYLFFRITKATKGKLSPTQDLLTKIRNITCQKKTKNTAVN